MQGNTNKSREIQREARFSPVVLLIFTLILLSQITDTKATDAPAETKSTKINTGNPGTSGSTFYPVSLNNYNTGYGKLVNQSGISSCYGKKFNNRRTSSGELHLSNGYSAAHRKYTFGTILRVTNLKNNKSTLVRVNDRGPFVRRRIIDISYTAAKEIDGVGTPKVVVEGYTRIKNSGTEQTGDVYCYSFDYPLISLHEESLRFLEGFEDFSDAVKAYREIMNENPGHYYFLAIRAKDYCNDSEKFYIADFNPNVDILVEEEKAIDLKKRMP